MKQAKIERVSVFTRGFLKVPNHVLEYIYSDDPIERMLGKLFLCILYHAYYSNGVVIVNKKSFPCHRGEWVTSFRIIEDKTGIPYHYVGSLLSIMETEHLITTRRFRRFTVITISGYDDLMKAPAAPPRSTPPKTRSQTAAIPQPASRPEYQRLGLN